MKRTIVIALAVAALAASPAAATLVTFRTPSGNVGCIGERSNGKSSVRCDIARRSWAPPRRPASCTLDWGQGLSLNGRGRARFVCAGDTALNTGRRAAYGTSVRIGPITCVSRTVGLTCTNVDAHGFFISRQSHRRF